MNTKREKKRRKGTSYDFTADGNRMKRGGCLEIKKWEAGEQRLRIRKAERSHSPCQRVRRGGFARNGWTGLNRQSLHGASKKSSTLFEKNVTGINVKRETNVRLAPKHPHGFEVGVGFTVRFGSPSVQLF